ncbi:hypothetical protein PRUPE_3G210900 [Prunus persica]|uniref:Uncharacterized protein n=1 Tax=Prunus persica TaxID=3760 RepID=A0A251Q4M0_PRUPE|nr:uncharacterized protein LOC18783818 isoform X1 [Prunus persica]ONI18350.1 hypothetical protein PRUPE_3G210900 [Prunus persica]
MGKCDAGRCIFPLTSLQIGDLQSYLSDLSLFLAPESKKFYILVDNRPWLGSRSAHLWQLMVTKSRLSPFANSKARKLRTEGKDACSLPKTAKPKKFARWFSLIKSQKKVLLPVKKLRTSLLLSQELHRTLYGFIVFEVAWSNVRGINYVNELQTDTSLAVEAKFMQRWEFDSIAQAASCISSWFSGTISEQLQLKEYLNSAIGSLHEGVSVAQDSEGEVFFDAKEYPDAEEYPETMPVVEENLSYNNLSMEENSLHCLSSNYSVHPETSENGTSVAHTPPPPSGPYKRRKITTSISTGVELDTYSEEMQNPETYISDSEDSETYTCYSEDEMQNSEAYSCNCEDEIQNSDVYTWDCEDEMLNSETFTSDCEDAIPETVKTTCDDAFKATQFREDAIPVTVDTYTSDSVDAVEATQYRDVLILFRFNDRDLPFKLREIIMSDLRLLTLLEAGLPSWVIFLQSYPGFCHIYRPWMCPLARALYVLISVVTVLIGFYDLYKNVPVLKVTASRLCGPLFDWIETWSMISRIKYLGTMLFLHNSQKAVQWFLTIRSTTRSFISVLAQPLAEPLLECFGFLIPVWNVLIEVIESLCSIIWILVGSSCSLVGNLVQILLVPIWFLLSAIWSIGTSIVYPMLRMLWEIVYAPVRMVVAVANVLAFICACIYDMLRDIWQFTSSIFQFASASQATVRTVEVSIWRSLWNDLFSQVFRAIRSILNGFVAFFIACNRHRLSIYNHIQEFIQRLLGRTRRSRREDSRRSKPTVETRNLSELRRKINLE